MNGALLQPNLALAADHAPKEWMRGATKSNNRY